MAQSDFGQWQPMESAPKDGTRVLVAVRGTEQGPAEVDVARWAKPGRAREKCWVAADSEPDCPITYAELELTSWMPLPSTLPKSRADFLRAGGPVPPESPDELSGSGI